MAARRALAHLPTPASYMFTPDFRGDSVACNLYVGGSGGVLGGCDCAGSLCSPAGLGSSGTGASPFGSVLSCATFAIDVILSPSFRFMMRTPWVLRPTMRT